MKYQGGRITSGTDNYRTRKDTFHALFSRLIEDESSTSWAHFEVLAEKGWFWNLLFLKEPAIEVAFLERGQLPLNFTRSFNKKLIPMIPANGHNIEKVFGKYPLWMSKN